MKRSAFMLLFFSAQIAFVVLQIHKHTHITKLSYQKQKLEAEKIALGKQKESLLNQWYMLTDRAEVKKFAEKELKLQQLSLTQVKKIDHDKQNV